MIAQFSFLSTVLSNFFYFFAFLRFILNGRSNFNAIVLTDLKGIVKRQNTGNC